MEAVRWKINLFGRLSAQRGERKITNFRTEKTALLLACLAQEPNRAIRREDLADRLWPDQPWEVVQGRLRVVLTYLRAILEPDPEDRGKILLADRREVRLAPSLLTTDTIEFEAKLLRADRVRDDSERITALEAAVEQYQAEFLHEFDALWITSERVRLADAYQLALRRLVQALMNQRRYDRALAVAQKALRADPYREETHRLLMLVYSKMGKPTAALRQYQELEALLKAQLGGAPSTETQNTLTKAIGPQPPAKPKTLGRDQTIPLPKPPKAPAKLSIIHLPSALTPLIGREDAISQVVAMLDTPETRLVNLTGVGGVGKTRLALAVAEKIRVHRRMVCFLPLVGLEDAGEICTRIAAAFSLPLRPRADLQERLVATLSDQSVLLVLDNVEHLLPEAAVVIRRLLEALPGLSCLTTSRQRLGISGEYCYAVRPLATPAPSDDPADVAEAPSVRLWLDRVRAISPDFRLTEANCCDVVSLCRTLEGIPLAIELAAAWADVLAPKQIATRLHSRFDVLVGRENQPFDERHTSLRAALDGSFDLLSPAVRKFFARLGRFRSGWTLEAAEAVCREPHALKYMAQLVDRSLVTTQEDEEGIRYGFLETVREYALMHLTGAEISEANRDFVDYFLGRAEEAPPLLKSSESSACMRRLKAEEENFRTAIALSIADTARPELPLRMCVGIYRYWYIDGGVREGRRWLSDALVLAPADSLHRPSALTALGNLAIAEGDAFSAERYYVECKDIYLRNQNKRGIANCLGNLGNVSRYLENYQQARTLALEALQIMQELGDVRGQALSLGNLALIATRSGDYEAAVGYGEKALTHFRCLGDKPNTMTGLLNMSTAALKLERCEQSAKLLGECLDLCILLNARIELGIVFNCAGIFCKHVGDLANAVQLTAAGSEMSRRLELSNTHSRNERRERDLAEIRLALGDAAVQREWDRGVELTEAAAINLAKSCLKRCA